MKTESPCSIASPCLLDKSSRKRPVSDLVASVEERGSLQMLKGFDRDDEVVSVRLQQPVRVLYLVIEFCYYESYRSSFLHRQLFATSNL